MHGQMKHEPLFRSIFVSAQVAAPAAAPTPVSIPFASQLLQLQSTLGKGRLITAKNAEVCCIQEEGYHDPAVQMRCRFCLHEPQQISSF